MMKGPWVIFLAEEMSLLGCRRAAVGGVITAAFLEPISYISTDL